MVVCGGGVNRVGILDVVDFLNNVVSACVVCMFLGV